MSAGTVAATTVKVVQPGEGRRRELMPGVGVIFKIDGADSGGALAVVEHPFEVGGASRPTSTTARMSSPSCSRARSASGPRTRRSCSVRADTS